MFAIEEYDGKQPTNPNWNKSSDTLNTLNLKFHAKVTGGIVAAVSTFANR